jgi:hypothetical protein
MMPKSDEKLKPLPCPFCGQIPTSCGWHIFTGNQVEHPKSNHYDITNKKFTNKPFCILSGLKTNAENWNRRQP